MSPRDMKHMQNSQDRNSSIPSTSWPDIMVGSQSCIDRGIKLASRDKPGAAHLPHRNTQAVTENRGWTAGRPQVVGPESIEIFLEQMQHNETNI